MSNSNYQIYNLVGYNTPENFINNFPSFVDQNKILDFEFLQDTLLIFQDDTTKPILALNLKLNHTQIENVSSNEFSERLVHIENYMPEEDRPKLFNTLHQAMNDKYNGSVGTFRFYLENGKVTVFRIRFYYLNNNTVSQNQESGLK